MCGKIQAKAVLFVDGNQPLRTLYVHLLGAKLFNHKVYAAEDGVSGISMLQHLPIDIVVTDLSLPDINGQTIFIMTRDHHLKTGNTMPLFIFCSGCEKALEDLQELCNGFEYHALVKPYRIQNLAKMIEDSCVPVEAALF